MNNLIATGTIVDVRTPEEYSQGHYPSAINIPLDQIQNRVGELKKMKPPVVVYCRSGNRSSMAVSVLKQNGMNEVYNGGALEDLMRAAK